MASKKHKNFSVAEKAKIVKQFNEFHGIKVEFAQLQKISMIAL